MQDLILKMTIPIPPVTKKNSKSAFVVPWTRKDGTKGQRAIIANGKTYTQYVKDVVFMLHADNRGNKDPISEKINIEAHYYMQTRRRVDKTNLESCLCDVLTDFCILADDNCTIVVGTDGSRVHVDPENPRTEIIITRLDERVDHLEKPAKKSKKKG